MLITIFIIIHKYQVMFFGKKSLVYCMQLATLGFLSYMLASGILFLMRDFNEKKSEKNTLEIKDYLKNSNEVNDNSSDCNNNHFWFYVSFALILGAYWNSGQLNKFGVI